MLAVDTADLQSIPFRLRPLSSPSQSPTCSLSPSQMDWKSGLAAILGRAMWTDARIVVPRFVGQKVR